MSRWAPHPLSLRQLQYLLAVAEAGHIAPSFGQQSVRENARTGRRNVVYRRHDGHYGLITPPSPAPEPPPSEERLIHEGSHPLGHPQG